MYASKTNSVVSRSLFAQLVLLTLVPCIGLASGCGKSSPPTAKVSGDFSIAGKPVQKGLIHFIPNGAGAPCKAEIIDGHYRAENVAIGKTTVMFHVLRPTGKVLKLFSSSAPQYDNLVPGKYRNGLELEVHEDEVHDFQL